MSQELQPHGRSVELAPADIGSPRLRPPLRIVVAAGLVVVALMVGAFMLGSALRGSDDDAYENGMREIYASTRVELKAAPSVTAEGAAEGGASLAINAVLPDDASIIQVSAEPLPVGTIVAPGAVVTAISGRPVFALPIASPYFRDLRLYDSGPDVLALNSALSGMGFDVDADESEYTWDTAQAIKELYANAGYDARRAAPQAPTAGTVATTPEVLPRGSMLPFAEVAPLPVAAMLVSSTAARFSIVEEGAPVVQLSSAVDSVTVVLNAVEIRDVAVGAEVVVSVPGSDAKSPGTVASIGDFHEGTSESNTVIEPGYDVRVNITDSATLALKAAQIVSVNFAPVTDEFLAVPATALQQQGTSTFVWLTEGAKERRVDVSVRVISDRWALLDDAVGLEVGDSIRVG